MPGVTWDAEADRKLLLFFLKDSNAKLNYEGAAAVISTADVPCTATAVESRVKKLRAIAKKNGGMDGIKSPTAGAEPTSLKGRGKKGTKRIAAESESEDNSKEASPTKRGRKGVAAATGKVKARGKGKKADEEAVSKEEEAVQGGVVKEEQDNDA